MCCVVGCVQNDGPFDVDRAAADRVKINAIAGCVIIPLAILIQGIEMIVDEITPPLAGAAPARKAVVEAEGAAAVAGDNTIDQKPAHRFDMDNAADPIATGKLIIGKLAASGLPIDDRVAAVDRTQVRPATHHQSFTVAEGLIDTVGETAVISPTP